MIFSPIFKGRRFFVCFCVLFFVYNQFLKSNQRSRYFVLMLSMMSFLRRHFCDVMHFNSLLWEEQEEIKKYNVD